MAKQVLAKALCNDDREALKQREKCPAQLILGGIRSHLQYSGQNKKVAHEYMGCVTECVKDSLQEAGGGKNPNKLQITTSTACLVGGDKTEQESDLEKELKAAE